MYFNQPPVEPKRPQKPVAKDANGNNVLPDDVDVLPIRPFVTHYRGAMMVVTCVAILAVDFNVFPRRFAKTESVGHSLMDLGVGSFVFSAGVVSVRQQLKEEEDKTGAFKTTFLQRMNDAIRHSLPLMALGFLRLRSVKSLDYQEHITEYGVHWNFFFTLALIPPCVAVFQSLFRLVPSYAFIGYGLSVIQQMLFTYTPLVEWAMLAPRVDLLSQNKEGIVSFAGYLAIFLCGQGIGACILRRDQDPRTPSSENDLWMADVLGGEEAVKKMASSQRQYAIVSLAKWSLIWCVVYYFTTGYYGPRLLVSRRLGNMAYVVWVNAFNCCQLLLFCGIETLLFPDIYSAKDKPAEQDRISKATSKVLHAFNRNGLAIFLLANMLTGAVNLSLSTLYMSDVPAMGVLVGYLTVLTGAALALDHYNVSIKI